MVTCENNKYRTFEDFTVSISELGRLLGKSQSCISAWHKYKGLPRLTNGLFCVPEVLRWLIKFYEEKHEIKYDKLSQSQLSDLLNVSRQSLTAWGRMGLPKNRNGEYQLKKVFHWLVQRYPALSEKKYQDRLEKLQNKLSRNFNQSLRFINRAKK